jgi:hypothetical protein
MLTLSDTAEFVCVRIKGPGGLYNAGNILGLIAGLAVAIDRAPEGVGLASSSRALGHFFVGSPAAVSLTVATLIFLWSGEHYYRAWRHGYPPHASLNRMGDVSSGIGAVVLGVGLSLLADPILAASSGFLHATGKFGSAFGPQGEHVLVGRPIKADDLYRCSVVVSRIPAIVVTLSQLSGILFAQTAGAEDQCLFLTALLICYALWAAADIMLMQAMWRGWWSLMSRRADGQHSGGAAVCISSRYPTAGKRQSRETHQHHGPG